MEQEQEPVKPSVSSRIQMFNGTGDQLTSNKSHSKPPELKPLLNINNNGRDGDCPSYINRSHVEKILSQQKKVCDMLYAVAMCFSLI